MRMFVALVPPGPVLDDLEAFVGPRRDAGPDLRWTPSEQWHLTLAFLPEVGERKLDDLVERLARAASRRQPLGLSLAGGGAFPHAAAARVLFTAVATDQGEELHLLAAGARAAGNKAGAVVDGGRFHPHLTLARARHPIDATRWLRILEAYRGPEWVAGEIALVESHLGEGPRNRPRYETVETFALGR